MSMKLILSIIAVMAFAAALSTPIMAADRAGDGADLNSQSTDQPPVVPGNPVNASGAQSTMSSRSTPEGADEGNSNSQNTYPSSVEKGDPVTTSGGESRGSHDTRPEDTSNGRYGRY